MARIIDGSGGGNDTLGNSATVKISAHGEDKIDMPDGMALADAVMTRDGMDLALTSADGSTVVIEGYFAADPAPVLAGMNGASLSPELVNSFLTSAPEYAQSATASDVSPVGAVEEIKGNASVTRTDGTTEKLTLGSPIYEGDIIQTDAQGAVNVVFIDETSMAVSANARMAVDAYSFDPATESGTTNFSVLRGVFVFTSGLIGRDDPDDVQIDTPVGSIGIRGTIIAGHINPHGESEITVVEGAIVVKNAVMEKTLAAQFETIRLGGIDSEMTEMGVLSAKAVGTAFGAVSDVAPSLFNAINDAAKEQGPAADGVNGRSENGTEDNGESNSRDSQPEPSKDPAQDMQMNDLNAPFKNDVFKEGAVKHANTLPVHENAAGHDNIDRPATNAPRDIAGPATMAHTPDAPVNTHHNNNNANTGNQGGTDPGGGTLVGPTPPTALELTTSMATDGVSRITDTGGRGIGYTVTSVGDANGDGYADIMFSNNTSQIAQNHVYIAYGSASGISSVGLNMPVIDTSITHISSSAAAAGEIALLANHTLAGTFNDFTNTIIKGIGDFNGDGIQDYMIAQPNNDADIFSPGTGVTQIISGANNSVLSELGNLMPLWQVGASIDALGDINNDGYADVIIGAPGGGTGESGYSFILYGSETPFSVINVMDLLTAGPMGRVITMANNGDQMGSAVAGIGDFNGDGFNDFAIGSPGHDYYHMGTTHTDSGVVKLYSGSNTSPFLTVFSTTPGTKIGSQIMGLGDLNGDGRSDILIAGETATDIAYVIFGGAGINVNVDSMGSAGFKLDAGGKILGAGTAGDFNGDGHNDLVFAVQNGADADIYVVYGGSALTNAIGGDGVLSLSDLDGNSNYVFKMTYAGGGTLNFDFSTAGDVNGDGFSDLVIGASDANGGNGEVFVVNGRAGGTGQYVYDETYTEGDPGHTDGSHLPNSMMATANGQILMGSMHDDYLYADTFDNVTLNGGRGNDTLIVRDSSFNSINGGAGGDILRLDGVGSILDLRGVTGNPNEIANRISQIEVLQFSQNDQQIILSVKNIFSLLQSSDDRTLKIGIDNSATGSMLKIDAEGTYTGSFSGQMIDALREVNANASHVGSSGGYETFDIGGYTLYIETALTADAQVV